MCRIMPNRNASSGKSTAELILAQKIKSIFNRLLPKKKCIKKIEKIQLNILMLETKVHFKLYKNSKKSWQDGVVTKKNWKHDVFNKTPAEGTKITPKPIKNQTYRKKRKTFQWKRSTTYLMCQYQKKLSLEGSVTDNVKRLNI